ncbi:MAG: CBS domain-containing protein [Candidatus Hydrogenedentota bacterium]
MDTARDIMTTDLITVTPEAPVYDAMCLLIDHRITGLPVVGGGGEMLGVVTEKDLLEAVYNGAMGPRGRVVDIMTTNLVCFEEDADIIDICESMIEGHFRRVPIVRGNRIVGIVSRRDVIRHTLEAYKLNMALPPA